MHWHGLRLENQYDGVPDETQVPIPIGGTYTCKVRFPDAGFYWYHPHIREDFGLEMGLYGTIVVEPADPSYWPAADRELTLTLDDLLVEDGHIAPFSRSGPTFVAMGRYGNVMLINGETRFSGQAAAGEVVRLYVVNTANTRIFNFAIRGARAKLVGGDSGRYERETFTGEVLLAPSERAVIDVLFDTPGEVRLEHRTPDHVYDLGGFTVTDGAPGAAAGSFETLRTDPELTAEHQAIGHDIEREPDKVLAFYSLMPLLYGGDATPASAYACPMHPEVTAAEPGTCPRCGMKLVAVAVTYACPMHPQVTAAEPGVCPDCGMKLVAGQADDADLLRVPDAPRGHRRRARDLPQVRDEAGALRCPAGPRFGAAPGRGAQRARPRRRPGVGGPDAGDQPGVGLRQHDLAAHRPARPGR